MLNSTNDNVFLFCSLQGMMQAKSYPDYAEHKKMHDDFVAKVSGLSAPVSSDTVHFAKDWSVKFA